MRKIISMVLVIAMIFSMAMPAFAVETPQYTFALSMTSDKETVNVEDTVTLMVTAETTLESVESFEYHLMYDTDKFEFVSGEKGESFSATSVDNATAESMVVITGLDTVNADPITVSAGTLCTVTFKAKEAAEAAEFSLVHEAMTVVVGNFEDFVDVAVTVPEAPITVSIAAAAGCEHTYVAGICTLCNEADPDYVAPSVTGILSLSRDAEYMTGAETGEIMAFKEITVPYFDLGLYGLEEYYFVSETYADDGDGLPGSDLEPGTAEYADGKVTMLHLLIYALEVYYYGLDEADAGKGYLYKEGLIGTEAFSISGSSGSSFMNQFWGGDCNLNYYVNYEYPLASDGWGATIDQILLRDGDLMTLGHFASYSFYADSYSIFNYIVSDNDNPTEGDEITLKLYYAGSNMDGSSGTAQNENNRELDVYYVPAGRITSADVTAWTYLGTTDANGELVVDTADLGAGEYIVAVAGQYGNEYSDEICSTPGGLQLTIASCSHTTWNDATCTTPKTCAKCGETEGEVNPDAHNYVDGVCEYCKAEVTVESNDAVVFEGEAALSGNADVTVTELILKDAKDKVFANYFSPDTGNELFVFLDGDKAAVGDSFEFAFTAEGADKDKAEFRIVEPIYRNKFTIQSYGYDMGQMQIQETSTWGSVNFGVKLALVTKFGLNSETLTLTTGNEGTLSLSTNSGDINTWLKPIVEWTTSDANVATVDGGKVTAVAPGTATITATVGNKTATCEVTVECDHDWSNANGVCAKTDCGFTCTHDWQDATCVAPKTCAVCSVTEGEVSNEHSFGEDGKCTVDGCDEEDPSANDVTVWTGVSQQKYSNLDFYVSEWYIEDGRDFVLGSVVTDDSSATYGNSTTLTIVDGDQIKVGSKINLGAVIEGEDKDKVNSITGNVATIQSYGFYMDQMRVTPTDYYSITNRFDIYPVNKFEFAQAELTMLDSETPTLTLALDSYFDRWSTPNVMSLVQWMSSDENVVTVEGGVLTAKGTGTATITAKVGNEYVSKTATCEVTVACDHEYFNGVCTKCEEADEAYVAITEITLGSFSTETVTDETGAAKKVLSLKKGATELMEVTLNEGATQGFSWSTSDESVATVDQDGVITAVGAGTATITVTAGDVVTFAAENTPVTASIEVTVTDVAEGYTLKMPADMSVTAGETVNIPVTLGSTSGTEYNAFDITVSYPEGLTLTSTEFDGLEVTADEGTIRIQAYGEAREAGSVPFILTFKANAIGEYPIEVTTAKVDNSTGAMGSDAPEAELIDGVTVVTITGYNVTLPDGFTGETVAAPGEDYSFSVPQDNFDYTVTVTVGGEPVEVTDEDGDGTYTIPGSEVDGEIVITATSAPKTFGVTLGEDMTGEETATFGTDYSATLTPDENYSYEVKITIGGKDYTGYSVSGNTWTIPGGDITGEIEFVVTKTQNSQGGDDGETQHAITFQGSGAGAAADCETKVSNGSDYILTLDKELGYDYTVTANVKNEDGTAGAAVEVTANEDGTYTIAAVRADLIITVERTMNCEVTVHNYVNLDGKTMFLVLVDGEHEDGKHYAYDGKAMYYSFDYEAYAYLTVEEGEFTKEIAAAKVTIAEGNKMTIRSQYDVNRTNLVDINDAQLVYDIYNGKYDEVADLGMVKFLYADVNVSKNVTVEDAAAVVANIK